MPTPTTQTTPTGETGIPMLMPQAGNTMEEGTILNWKVTVGDTVTIGQILGEVETDKASVEIESTEAGTITWLAPQGSVVPVKKPIALFGGRNTAPPTHIAAPPAPAPQAAPAAPPPVITRAAPVEVSRVRASPLARKIATARGIDLRTIQRGSGPDGRILSADIPASGAAPPPPAGPGRRFPMSKMRRAIATNLQTSKQTVPHFYVRLTINADPLFTFYKSQKPATGCTLNDVILLAVGRLVAEFPAFRTRLEGKDLIEAESANIGVAVSATDGLIVPVVLNIGALSLAQLVPAARRVIESARTGKIENLGKGVFTISNMGMLGVEEFAAIINPPESGILAVAALRESVIVKDGAMRPGRVMTMTLSVDHRVVDGALAAQFMARLRELLETPDKLLSDARP